MEHRLQEAFGAVRAEEALKERTRESLRRKTRDYTRRARPGYRRLIPAMACLLLLLSGLGGYRLYFTPTAVVSIDVNPSVELGINRFDRVVSVAGYNADGDALAAALQVRFLDYTEALEQVLASQVVADCLARGEALSITVVGDDPAQREHLLSSSAACTAGQENAYCHAIGYGEAEAAHAAGLSYGKYMAFLELQALDPDITAGEVREMTMREIRDRIAALSGGETGGAQSGHGHGYCHGDGNRGGARG